jgi:hypothetical protein
MEAASDTVVLTIWYMPASHPELIPTLQLACPFCGETKQWRPRWVYSRSFQALCGRCSKRWRSQLPPIQPKLVVLDTNALSELTKLTLPNFPPHRLARLGQWREVSDRLERANRLQLVACPETPTFDREVTLTKMGAEIQKTADRFSNGLSYCQAFRVVSSQLFAAVCASRMGQAVQRIDRADVMLGRLNEWQNIFQFKVDLGFHTTPSDVRAARDRLHVSADSVFRGWEVTARSIDQIYCDELEAFGRHMVRKYHRYLKAAVEGKSTLDDLIEPVWEEIGIVRNALETCGVLKSESIAEMVTFMLSPSAANIPANRLSAALYAYEARKMAGGMARPKPSMWLDIEMLSTVLPYCDAVLIEGHFAEALRATRRFQPDECREVKVFSTRELPDFVRYLDELIARCPEEQRRAALALYEGKVD